VAAFAFGRWTAHIPAHEGQTIRMITMPLALVDKKTILRANMALVLGIVWGGLAFCAIAAVIYDVRHWIGAF